MRSHALRRAATDHRSLPVREVDERLAGRLADDEVFFPQKGPIVSPQLDLPVACSFWADGIAAECPIPAAWTRGHTKPPDLMHAFTAVPAMLHGRIRVRQQSRVENVRARLPIAVH